MAGPATPTPVMAHSFTHPTRASAKAAALRWITTAISSSAKVIGVMCGVSASFRCIDHLREPLNLRNYTAIERSHALYGNSKPFEQIPDLHLVSISLFLW